MLAKLFQRKRVEKSEKFIGNLSEKSTEFLKEAYMYLDADMAIGRYNDRTKEELIAVEAELNARGLVHMRDY